MKEKTRKVKSKKEKSSNTLILGDFNTVEKIKEERIVEVYSEKLKSIRYELKELKYEYEEIKEEKDDTYEIERLDDLRNKLTIIIKKLDEYKELLSDPESIRYDSNYLKNLVNEYIKEFENNNFVDEITNSDIYIEISSMIKNIGEEKEKTVKSIDEKQKNLDSLDKDKDNYLKEFDNFDKINDMLQDLEKEQEKILRDIEDKVKNCVSIREEVEVITKEMFLSTKALIALIAANAAPGIKNIKTSTATILIGVIALKEALFPKTETKVTRHVKVKDYSGEINSSIVELENTSKVIDRTSEEVFAIMEDFTHDYAEYIDEIPECKELLNNLTVISDELSERGYEISRIIDKQENMLDENLEKIKTLDED